MSSWGPVQSRSSEADVSPGGSVFGNLCSRECHVSPLPRWHVSYEVGVSVLRPIPAHVVREPVGSPVSGLLPRCAGPDSSSHPWGVVRLWQFGGVRGNRKGMNRPRGKDVSFSGTVEVGNPVPWTWGGGTQGSSISLGHLPPT